MNSNIENRINTAQAALSKAQSELGGKISYKQFRKDYSICTDALSLLATNGMKTGIFFVANSGVKTYIDVKNGEDAGEIIAGLLADAATVAFFFFKRTPWGAAISMEMDMFEVDPSTLVKKLHNWATGTDLKEYPIIQNGFLRITMPDGTVYARPFALDAKGLITGDSKDDVLFGGSGNDILQGGLGSDILLGGNGYDTYNADNGDFIRDIDGRGRIYLDGGKLTGGKWNEKKQAYIDKDGATYKLDNNSNILTVSKNGHQIIIDMFDKDKKTLDIVLQDAKEVLVSVSDVTAGEKDEKMEFKISLDRKLEKEETLTLKINDKEIAFKENDQEKTYTYTWKDNQTKNEDINFEINPQIVTDKSNVKAKIEKPGLGKIIDDDRDPDPDDPETEASPIVLDLNKNGITSTKLNNTVYFDHDNNGFKEATAWIEKDDGLLALDKNGNGKIDNGSELFGNHTVSNTAYGYTDPKATNGYEALKTYDINNDNVIDEKDEIFSKLKIWKDKNSNGITDEGELSSLAHNNIKSIDLNYKEIAMGENSNTVKQSSKVILKDGSTLDANDVWFKVNLDKTKEEDINIPLEIKSLPQVKAFGNLNSLQVATSKNDTLAAMINLYLMLNPEDRKNHVDDIVYEWAGVNDMDEALMRG